MTLADVLTPCGPVLDAKAAERLRGHVAMQVWTPALEAAWPAIAPVVAAPPYLASLIPRNPQRAADRLDAEPDSRLDDLLARTAAVEALLPEAAEAPLRVLKQELHLLTALCDLGGVWDLDQVTGAL